MLKQAFILVIAYPDNFVIVPDKWYKPLIAFVGLSRYGLFKGGHAAMVLLDNNGEMFYTDFGRYGTKPGFGRARSKLTDPELELKIAPIWENGELKNLDEIILYLGSNSHETHGEGVMYASICQPVNFKLAKNAVIEYQNREMIPYDPFGKSNTNCSRFVQSVLLEGVVDIHLKKQIAKKKFVSATPIANVSNADSGFGIYKVKDGRLYKNIRINRLKFFFDFLHKLKRPPERFDYHKMPTRNPSIPKKSSWVGGTGAGSWFHLEDVYENNYLISRYEANGQRIFSALFEISEDGFNPNQPYHFSHLCNYNSCILEQNQKRFRCTRVKGMDHIIDSKNQFIKKKSFVRK